MNGTSVTTNTLTTFEHGTCSDVQNGVQVEVEGFLQPGDGTVLASKVELDIEEEDEDEDEEVKLDGSVSDLSGGCPNLSFTVDGTTVTTDGDTAFDGGACSDVQNGTEVKVEGLRQPDGSVLASEVELDD